MEFICVLSVEGALASYQVRRESEDSYLAVLRTNNGSRDDVPAEITLKKENDKWQAQPWHEDVVRGLIHAINAAQ